MPIEPAFIKSFYGKPSTVRHYSDATAALGLWRSEEKLIGEHLMRDETILDLGCGTGRVALGLWELGYRNLLGVDFVREMVVEARRLARLLDYGVPFRVGDAMNLTFDDGAFDGVIFAFNGLMLIPGADQRLKALSEVKRVLRPGGRFIFTTHDQGDPAFAGFWEQERERWADGPPDERLIDFGDRLVPGMGGVTYVHIPSAAEVREMLERAGLDCVFDGMRSDVADEPKEVTSFSDECRFWVARKPE